MAVERSPALQTYPKDWRDVKVRRMSLSAQGAYRAILDDMWADSKDQCSVLDCDPFIAKSLGISVKEWITLRKEIQHEFEPLLLQKDGRLYSKRLKAEALKQRNYRKSQSEKGKKSAEKRANHGSTAVPTGGQPEGKSSSSSSSSSSLKKEKRGREGAMRQPTPEIPIPEEWLPNESHVTLARIRGLDLPIEAAHFRGKAGEHGWVTKDWNQKFTNWMLQEIKFRQRRPQ